MLSKFDSFVYGFTVGTSHKQVKWKFKALSSVPYMLHLFNSFNVKSRNKKERNKQRKKETKERKEKKKHTKISSQKQRKIK